MQNFPRDAEISPQSGEDRPVWAPSFGRYGGGDWPGFHMAQPVSAPLEPRVFFALALAFTSLHKQAVAGDLSAVAAIQEIWLEHTDKELSCFLCDTLVIERPILMEILPENGEYNTVIAAPLCQSCFDLPEMFRMGRRLKIVKRMWKTRKGKSITFHFNVAERHQHRRVR